jgi:hypothetical protein
VCLHDQQLLYNSERVYYLTFLPLNVERYCVQSNEHRGGILLCQGYECVEIADDN